MKKRSSQAQGLVPAAQYLRMSTEHQRFSFDNQRAAISAYALADGYEVVATYEDPAKSGLTLKKRPGLKKLLGDVLAGDAPFRAILVLDVSRWGRFQDADQAAHYEYMCREAGVPVRYCSEAFDNDGGGMASIVKQMKRVMAAEYSRELSTKVSRAQRQQAGLGYKQGGTTVVGVRRQLVDRHGRPRKLLKAGERKALAAERVAWIAGPPEEVDMVRRAFRMFVHDEMRITAIAHELNGHCKDERGRRFWTYDTVRHMLSNEIYIGTYVFGRRRSNLGQPTASPSEEWIKARVMEPILEPALFAASVARLQNITRRPYSDEQITAGLARLLDEKGALTAKIVRECPYLPSDGRLAVRYGGLDNVYALIGYKRPARRQYLSFRALYTDEEALDQLRQVYRENGAISQRLINLNTALPNARHFADRFGSLPAAYRQAGLPPVPTGDLKESFATIAGTATARPSKRRYRVGRQLDDTQLLDGLRRLIREHGYLSEAVIESDIHLPNAKHYRERFGSLMAAYDKVGFASARGDIVEAGFRRRRGSRQ
ncbi:recombinase family protein [Sphingomonas immobilis]|uniref:Recombinase family protein n=1 Tax=Sphingomonas immobilis TaxID=3063997 RepID=A0ABT9A3J6_9SPHN|nr:recombinase family protein [Sphingomonas sp. CA1-15]MDO7843785.1 recombinase family protein [Sphingomonas sp. CA1-15]